MKQREIKFRCWANKKMWSCAVPRLSPAHNGGMIEVSDKPDGAFNQFVNGVLMQFTGLYDKSGKPIYEGDVVKDGAPRLWIIGINTYTGIIFKLYKDQNIIYRYGDFNNFHKDNLEIIGNIYEHPHLLEQNHD